MLAILEAKSRNLFHGFSDEVTIMTILGATIA